MKKEGSLKSILAILVIILLCLVSLGGIYVKDKNIMKNILPDYVLGMDLDTNTVIKLDVLKSQENSSEETKEENGQAENIYTIDNYKKSKEIIENRLKKSGINQYTVRLDESTGSIVLEVPSNTEPSALQNVFVVGKTEIKIKETNEVIGDYKSFSKIETDIDDSYAGYGIGSFVKLDITFSKDAVNKFKEIKANYVIPANDEGTQTENNIQILIDGSAICSMTETAFLDAAINGTLPLKYGDYTKDTNILNKTLEESKSVKNIIESGNLPITYSVKYTNDIHSNVNIIGIASVFAIILIVMFIYLVIKFKVKGIFAELSILGFGSLLMLVLRYTNVELSIASLAAIAGILILQFIYLINLLKIEKISTKKFNEKIIDYTKMIIPMFLIAVVIAFANITEISGFGMVIFWALILFELFNNIITRAILTNVKNK